jgi:asparagine synthase (glutamine-hydrolysing)
MCGIAAFFSPSKPVLTDVLQGAVQNLIHRGPDNQSVWLSKDRRVGLGHTRLSIIDLATGDQPIANENERVRIVVNGEFYDFERQRCELERRGHQFRTRSDSEIALHLYEDFGVHCMRHLRGEFAFVLWDESNELLLAARDRFGIKPLYYAVHGDTLYLASEVKALLAAGVPARWNHEIPAMRTRSPSGSWQKPQRTPSFRSTITAPSGT